jgi:3-hydroxy acid dehydrogenase/malonic semialdehyde reductase
VAEPDDAILRPGAVALVTGASSGIGRALVRMLGERGLRVAGIGRDPDRLDQAMASLGSSGIAVPLDLTDGLAVARILERLPEDWRGIDIVVNNAGHDVGGRRRLDEGQADDWAAIIETNVSGLIRMTHAVLPGMLERDRGHIVNVGSIAGLRAYKGGNVYNASKFAVHGLSDALRLDYDGTRLRVTEILPGLVRTGFAAARSRGDQAAAQAFYESFPAAMEPDDVARTIVFALEQPSHVTIAQLVVVPTLTGRTPPPMAVRSRATG